MNSNNQAVEAAVQRLMRLAETMAHYACVVSSASDESLERHAEAHSRLVTALRAELARPLEVADSEGLPPLPPCAYTTAEIEQAFKKYAADAIAASRAPVALGAEPEKNNPSEEPTTLQILAITTAYEQGVGKGHQAYSSGKEISNPYSASWRCDHAWSLGYKEGKDQAARTAPPAQGDAKDARKYRLLTVNDQIQKDDEFIQDDGVTWLNPVGWEVGAKYHGVFKTARRPSVATSSKRVES